jgi:hypothetical protein
MKAEPKISYQQAFTREYLHPDNRPLKSRVDAESILHRSALLRQSLFRHMRGDEICFAEVAGRPGLI